MRVVAEWPTDDYDVPVDLKRGTDVICLSDETNVFLALEVHPVEDPSQVFRVRYDDLALYDDGTPLPPLPKYNSVFPVHATGLSGRPMRVVGRPVNFVGEIQDIPVDVIAIDDTPDAEHNLLVRAADDPNRTARISYDQLNLCDIT